MFLIHCAVCSPTTKTMLKVNEKQLQKCSRHNKVKKKIYVYVIVFYIKWYGYVGISDSHRIAEALIVNLFQCAQMTHVLTKPP